jgi:uncharacterized membrane protein
VAFVDEILVPLTFAAALGSGLIAGAFYAFSTFVMKALARLQPDAGIAAMQSINVVVINPLFLGVFVGTAGLCVLLIIGALMRWEKPGAGYLLAGSVLYVVGTFLVTMICNVPLNNSLAALAIDAPDAAQRWAEYVSKWTMWNHIRTVAALLALGSFAIALRRCSAT